MRRKVMVVAAIAALGAPSIPGQATAQETPPPGVPVVWLSGSIIYGNGIAVIPAGGPATYFNLDPLGPHNVVSTQGLFTSGAAIGAGSWSVLQITGALSTGGQYPYVCTVHPNMTGILVAV